MIEGFRFIENREECIIAVQTDQVIRPIDAVPRRDCCNLDACAQVSQVRSQLPTRALNFRVAGGVAIEANDDFAGLPEDPAEIWQWATRLFASALRSGSNSRLALPTTTSASTDCQKAHTAPLCQSCHGQSRFFSLDEYNRSHYFS